MDAVGERASDRHILCAGRSLAGVKIQEKERFLVAALACGRLLGMTAEELKTISPRK